MAEVSNAYGALEDADATRQAQHLLANDMIVDVNNNAASARYNALTTGLAGHSAQSNQDRRDKMADAGVGIFRSV
jgi:hypothetical protein